jgi:riboflavin synthase
MFTGIIEQVGKLEALTIRGEKRRIQISSRPISEQLKTGESVSVNGVCLTALEINADTFQADLAPETWRLTSLSRLVAGASVNLELAMRANGRFDGHIVQGHADGVGILTGFDRIRDSDNWWLKIEVPEGLEKYVVHKGSIAIEGISLTVASLHVLELTVAVIPQTAKKTNLVTLRPGDPVNLEVDVLAKYVEKMLRTPDRQEKIALGNLIRSGF